MSALWTRDALVAATGGTAQGDWAGVAAVGIDTRNLEAGELFVALKDQRDGHDFVAAALNGGASAALVSRRPDGVAEDAPLLVVDNPLGALERIAVASRARAAAASVIAVTGSVGKTSAKEALRVVLGAQAPTHVSEKSYNNHWGVPLSLARMPEGSRFAVFEIGMNHSGEITPLTKMARPDVAVITTVTAAHLGNFNDESEIAAAKAEIMDGLKPGGVVVLNRDNRWFDLLATKAASLDLRIVAFGRHASAKARLLNHIQNPDSASVEAEILGERVLFKLAAPGTHHAMNALAVLSAAKLAGADLARSALALSEWKPGDGRGAQQKIRLDPIDAQSAFLLIDESYNANPASVEAAFETLALAQTGNNATGRDGRRIAVLGDMLELGPQADAIHAALAQAEGLAKLDLVHLCGPHMRALYEALPADRRGIWEPDSAALAERLAPMIRAGDAVMVKGSLGSAMKKIVDALTALGRASRRT